MEDKTLYVVTGFMRTGTSMMMKALEAGGLTAEYQQSRNEMKQRFADEHYDPNVGGLYELERNDYMSPYFPKGYEGKLIKNLNMEHKTRNGRGKSFEVMPDGIRVVMMTREPEEIRQSFDAFFGRQLDIQVIETLPDRWERMETFIRNRKDVLSLHIFDYRNVVNNPLPAFELLADSGWPIEPEKCAEVVDPEYYRFRLEELEIGVY